MVSVQGESHSTASLEKLFKNPLVILIFCLLSIRFREVAKILLSVYCFSTPFQHVHQLIR